MKRLLKLSILISFLPFFSYGQSNYKPGYVVNLKGDTLRGFIDYREWDKNPKSIAFKKDIGQGVPEVFTTKIASAFAISGLEYYEKHAISISNDEVDINKISIGIDTSTHADTVFLRLLTRGKNASLYNYFDETKQRFYLSTPGVLEPQELVYHAYNKPGETSSIYYVKRFHIQLENLAQNNNMSNDKLSREIDRSDYSATDLVSIVQSINGGTFGQFTPMKHSGISWFAGAGVNYSKFIFTGAIELDGAPASKNISPKLDAGINFFINKNTQRFYLRAEVTFTYGQYSFSQRDMGSVTFSTSSLNLKLYNAAFIPQVVYNLYNNERISVFIDAGFAINLPVYNNYSLIKKYDSFPTEVLNKYPQLTKNYFTLPLKAGFTVSRRLEAYVCYVPTTSLTAPNPHTTNFGSNMTSYQAGLNYIFGSK